MSCSLFPDFLFFFLKIQIAKCPENHFNNPKNLLIFSILSLPMPEEAPKGLVLLIKQCLSQKGRNRPSFSHIRQHWEIFKPELFEMTEEEWQLAWDSYREFAKCIQYPSTVTRDHGGPKSAFAMEEEIQRKRHEQLNHIKVRNILLVFN